MKREYDDFEGSGWYKRNPKRFIGGVIGMGAALIGCYSVILDLIYEHEGSIPNDHRWIGGILGESVRQTGAMVKELIQRGKLTVNPNGRLENGRATKVLASRSKSPEKVVEKSAKDQDNGKAPEPARRKNNDLGRTDKTRKDKIRSEKKDEGAKAPLSDAGTPAGAVPVSQPVEAVVETDLDLAVRAYNEAAAQCPDKPNAHGNAGWARCVNLTANREKAVRARLKEIGLDGWRVAMMRGAQSDFLSGRAKRQPGRERWGVDIGWIAKAENFVKLCEGRYDNDRGRAARPVGQESARAGLMAFLDEGETQDG